MTNALRLLFLVAIPVIVLLRLSVSESYEDVPFFDRITASLAAQGAEVVGGRPERYVTFAVPSCEGHISVIPFNITYKPDPLLTLYGFEGQTYSVAYLGYSGPDPGKLRLIWELLATRFSQALQTRQSFATGNEAILIVHDDSCDPAQALDLARFWRLPTD